MLKFHFPALLRNFSLAKISSVFALMAMSCAQTLFSPSSFAAYPEKPIRLVVPSGAGGVTDALARVLSVQMSQLLGQSVFVDNRPGASGITGSQFVANSAPDGYNLLMVFPSHVTNPSLFKKLPYDTLKSFAPVAFVSSVSMVFVVPKNSPANTLSEFINYAKDQPGKLNFASVGSGSLGHLGAELFNSMTGNKIQHVPYKGSPQAMTSLLSNEVQMYLVASASSVIPLMESKQLKVLAVSTKDRLNILPNVPAMGQTIPGYEALGWNAILAPAGTPNEIIQKLHAVIEQSLGSKEFIQKLRVEGASVLTGSPQDVQLTIQKEIDKWAKVIKTADIQLD